MQKKSFKIECQFFHDRFWPASAVKIRGKWMRIDIRQAECSCNILTGIPCAFDAHLIRRGVAAAMPSPQGGGIARGRCRISSEAGLAPAGFPAAQIFQNRRSFAPQGGRQKVRSCTKALPIWEGFAILIYAYTPACGAHRYCRTRRSQAGTGDGDGALRLADGAHGAAAGGQVAHLRGKGLTGFLR